MRVATALALLGLLVAPRVARGDDPVASREVERLLSASDPPGTLAGAPARYRVTTTGRGAGRGSHGELHVTLATPAEIQLQLRRQDASEVALARAGRVIDLDLGDPGFDAAFVVEGAPSDLVRALLDAPARRALTGLPRAIVNVEARSLDVTLEGAPRSLDEARQLVALAALLAERLRAGPAPRPDVALLPAARAAELARLRALLAARQRQNIPFLIFMGLVGLAVVVLLLRNIARKPRTTR